jgi:hypothetical protein
MWGGDSMAEDFSNIICIGIGEDMTQRPSKRARRRPDTFQKKSGSPDVDLNLRVFATDYQSNQVSEPKSGRRNVTLQIVATGNLHKI